MTDSSERLVDERYSIIKKVGQGAMGEVYQCFDTQLNCTVAVKLLSYDAPEDAVVRFQREAKNTAKLNHGNILKVRDFKRSKDGRLFLVMDFLEGENLADYIGRHRETDPEEILDILEQICSALEYSHRAGILHRDIKPSNIILAPGGDGLDAKIIDFGIAKLKQVDNTLTKAGMSVGTPAYMAPEAVRGEDAEPRSDIYSFGVMMYELLCDEKPFSGANNLETLLMQLNAPPPSLKEKRLSAQLRPYIASLEPIVLRCLEKDKEKRFASFSEVRDALESCAPQLEGGTITCVQTSPRKLLVPIAVLVLIIVVGYIATEMVINRKETEGVIAIRGSFESALTETVPMDPAVIKEVGRNKGTLEFKTEGIMPKVKGTPLVTDDEDVVVAVASELRNRKAWDLSKTSITGKAIKALQNTELTHLDLSTTNLGDKDLEEVAKLKRLENLSLLKCDNLTNKGVGKLRVLKNLNSLSVSGKQISAGVLDELTKFQKLTYLSTRRINLTEKDLQKLKKLRPLQTLCWSTARLPKGFDSAIDQTAATSVNLECCQLEPSFAMLGRSKSFFQLVLQRCVPVGKLDSVPEESGAVYAKLDEQIYLELAKSSITWLGLTGCRLNSDDLRTLNLAPRVDRLQLTNVALENQSDLLELAKFKKLRHLDLSGYAGKEMITEFDQKNLKLLLKKCSVNVSEPKHF